MTAQYRLYSLLLSKEPTMVQKIDCDPVLSIPFAPGNTDYDTFKAEILTDQAQLEDVDGNVMSPEAAKEYVRSLP